MKRWVKLANPAQLAPVQLTLTGDCHTIKDVIKSLKHEFSPLFNGVLLKDINLAMTKGGETLQHQASIPERKRPSSSPSHQTRPEAPFSIKYRTIHHPSQPSLCSPPFTRSHQHLELCGKRNKLLTIPCHADGKLWDRVQQFLFSVCGDFDTTQYVLRDAKNGQALHLEHREIKVPPGRYSFAPKVGSDAEALRIIHTPFPIIPKGRVSASNSGTSTPESVETQRRSGLFEKDVIARDNHCVVTREYAATQPAHILAHSWWTKSNTRKLLLPQDILEAVTDIREEINGVRNGILLRADLATAFDKGLFSFIYANNHYYFVAITPEYEEFDGRQLDENLRVRSDGTLWWSSFTCPHPKLVEFHFRNSVFRHMKGTAEPRLDEQWSDDEDLDVLIARRKLENVFNGSEVGMYLSRFISSDTLVDIQGLESSQ